MNKFSQIIKKFKNLADAVTRIDATGKGLISLDQFKKKLDEIKALTNDEKLVIAFIPFNQNKQDPWEINI